MIWARAATPRSPWGIWRPIGPLSSSTLGTSRMPTSTCLMYVCACGLFAWAEWSHSPHLCCARIAIFPMPGDVLLEGCFSGSDLQDIFAVVGSPSFQCDGMLLLAGHGNGEDNQHLRIQPPPVRPTVGCTLPTVQLPRQQTTTSLSFHHSC